MRARLLIALALLLPSPVSAIAERALNGRLVLENFQGELAAADGVLVKIQATEESTRTDEAGLFRFAPQQRNRHGGILKLRVDKPGWVIHQPLDGEIRPSADPNEPVEIRLLPKGSQRLWNDERIEALIAELAFSAKGQVTPDGDPGGIDFGGPIRDWADRYGFDPDQVQTQIDRWVSEVEQAHGDLYRQGLAAVAKKHLGEAERFFGESADTKAKRLERARQAPLGEASALADQAVRDFRLAGDCAYADYRFADARDRYRAALSLLDRTEQPEPSAATLHDLAAANYELGIRTGDSDSSAHLSRTLDALKAALALQSLEAMPSQWTRTQAMLLRVYERMGDATGMASVVAELSVAEPDNREYYKLAHALNHEVLFDFQEAHDRTAAWLERYPDDLDALCNLAETHFTTGRFAQADGHLKVLLESGQLPPELEAAMRLVEIANLLAQGRSGEVPARLDELRARIDAQAEDFNVGWAFEGSSHFVGREPTLEDHRGMLYGLLWAAETAQRDALLSAIEKARVALDPNP